MSTPRAARFAYYETKSAQPPGALLVDLARAFRVSTDELRGVTPMRDTLSPKTARLLKRLCRTEDGARRAGVFTRIAAPIRNPAMDLAGLAATRGG